MLKRPIKALITRSDGIISLVESLLLMSETFCRLPTRMLLGPDVLLGESFHPSSKKRNQRALISTLVPSANIAKRSRQNSRRSAKMFLTS